jgi:hypothetical protein
VDNVEESSLPKSTIDRVHPIDINEEERLCLYQREEMEGNEGDEQALDIANVSLFHEVKNSELIPDEADLYCDGGKCEIRSTH